MSQDLDQFRSEVAGWLADNFPPSLANMNFGFEGDSDGSKAAELDLWRSRLAEQGWGAPTWPTEYGGAGLSDPEAKVIGQEMHKVGAFNHIPMITGMGITMVGPTVLEYGTDDQKERHLPGIASGEIRWCLGLSEPNAGSDLAGLSTRAEDDGDAYVDSGGGAALGLTTGGMKNDGKGRALGGRRGQ